MKIEKVTTNIIFQLCFFDQTIKNNLRTYGNIATKLATSQGDDYKTGCLLEYPYFKKYYKLKSANLSTQ